MKGLTSATVPIAPGGPYHQLRVQAQNQLGVSAGGPAGDPFRLDLTDNTNNNNAVTYTTAWGAANPADPNAYGGTLETASSTGSATMTFPSGRFVAVIAPLGPAYGTMQVCLDPSHVAASPCTPVMLHAATATERDTVYVSSLLTPGPHTIEVSHTSGTIALDAFVVLG